MLGPAVMAGLFRSDPSTGADGRNVSRARGFLVQEEQEGPKGMKPHHLIAATAFTAGLALSATTAIADCASELESLAGVSKDGAAAPLAEGATPQTGATTSSDASKADAGKAGDLMPMGENTDVATSAEDAQAQSEGGETAASQAMDDADGDEDAQAQGEGGETASSQAMGAAGGDEAGRQGAINEARAALAAGDEDACLAALEKAKSM
jgi:hypothetical protein